MRFGGWFWKWLWSMAAVLVCVSGCVVAADVQENPDPPPAPTPRDRSDGGSDESPGVAVSVTVPADAWQWLATNLNQFGVTVTKPITLQGDDKAGLSVAEGTTVGLDVAREHALVTFGGPLLPKATKRVGPIPVTTTIKSLTLKPDGSGLAKTGVGSWPFRWLSSDGDTGVAAAQSSATQRVEVTLETPLDSEGQRFCAPCKEVEDAYRRCSLDLPFKLVVVEVQPMAGRSYPRMTWKGSGDKVWETVGAVDMATLSYQVVKTASAK